MRPFLAAIQPMVQAGSLASLLAQFPYSLLWEDPLTSLRHLLRLQEAISAGLLVHAKFRRGFWNRPEALDSLVDHDLVNVDLPRLPGLPPAHTSYATIPIGYVRFHGQNAARFEEEVVGARGGQRTLRLRVFTGFRPSATSPSARASPSSGIQVGQVKPSLLVFMVFLLVTVYRSIASRILGLT
ncbi:MAG: DUF72 domain-containing protein [Candidatus Bipolaricaulota bacterium]|nr:DUF72 domain-containing protein [Candidatus Bipolaricaulota bacterium]MDW8127539.1 DUF72 domain-containing protein [Candidatus Bipolaricaulota bacterium]